MQIPVIYSANVALLFSSLLIGFAVFWGISKALSFLRH